MLAECRYREALNLILQLPDPEARFWRAVNEDEELYCIIHDVDPDAPDDEYDDDEEVESQPISPPYQSWGMGEELTAQLIDALHIFRVEHAYKGSGKSAPKTKPLPRPSTMSSRIQARRDKVWAADFEDELKSMAVKK